jgi:hypothetical protein
LSSEVSPDFPRKKVIDQSPFPEIISKILDSTERNEQLALLEEYISSFDTWIESADLTKQDRITIENALFSHEKIIELAKNWLLEGSKELASFRQKSKVIMAYADNLPKRLNRYRPLKG